MKREEEKHASMAKTLTSLKNEQNNKRLELLTEAMFAHFGGLAGFVTAWENYAEHAMKDGGLPAFRCFAATIRLLQYCEEQRRSKTDP